MKLVLFLCPRDCLNRPVKSSAVRGTIESQPSPLTLICQLLVSDNGQDASGEASTDLHYLVDLALFAVFYIF